MRRYLTLIALLTLPAFAQQKLQAPDLIALAKSGKPELRVAITGTFDSGALQDGTAWIGHGPDFFFAVETDIAPSLVIDEAAANITEAAAGWLACRHDENRADSIRSVTEPLNSEQSGTTS